MKSPQASSHPSPAGSVYSRRRFAGTFLGTLLSRSLLAAEFELGRSYFGDKDYIEYVAGSLPLVISAPHGGRETPEDIPSRENGVVQMDTNSQELARTIAEVIHRRTSQRAHLVICRLHRQKLDCNREMGEAAAGNPAAEKAWTEYHTFIEKALSAATDQAGKAFYIDLHGQNHADHRIELGYLHSVQTLGKPDAVLNSEGVKRESSIRRLAEGSPTPYVELLRGAGSLGGLLEAKGFPCTPSPERPVPRIPYFQGGYSVRRHVAEDAPIAGLQIETNLVGLRDQDETRTEFAEALVSVLIDYLAAHFHLTLGH